MDLTIRGNENDPVVSCVEEVPAVAAVSVDDAGARDPVSRVRRAARARPSRTRTHHVWPGPLLLLPAAVGDGALPRARRLRARRQTDRIPLQQFRTRGSAPADRRHWLRPSDGVCPVAARVGPPLPALPVVRRGEGEAPRLVAQLPVGWQG